MNEPKLRFKADDGSQFPDWEEKRLNEIAARVTRKNKDNVTDIPLTISSADGLIDQRNFFNKVVASKDMSGYYLLKNGEFAYNKSYSKGYDFGSIKRLDLYDEGALSTLYICFALNKNEKSDFYQKYFDSLSWYPELQKICAEGARNHGLLNVPTNDFFQLKLCVPSSEQEQQKIAEFLSTVDTVIEKQKGTVSAWEERKKGVMQKLFGQEVRFKADDGSQFPDWEEHEIAELIQLYNEKVSSDCQLPILTSSKKNGIEYQEEHFAGKQRHDIEGYNVLPRNYCTYRNRSDGTDFTFNINKLCDKGIVSKFYPVFKEKDCDLFFLVSLLNNERKTVRKIAYTAKGTGQKVLSIIDLRNITVNMPSLPEQQKIADCLSSLDEVIEKQKATLAAWEELKKGLLQQMFA